MINNQFPFAHSYSLPIDSLLTDSRLINYGFEVFLFWRFGLGKYVCGWALLLMQISQQLQIAQVLLLLLLVILL